MYLLLCLLCITVGLPCLAAVPAQRAVTPVDTIAYDGGSSCPGTLPAAGDFEFPHLIIPISATDPHTAYANTLTPFVTAGNMSQVFNFDIPPGRKGQTCTFQFLFPAQQQLTTSFFQLRGFGTYSFAISALGAGAQEGITTFENRPQSAYVHGFPRGISMQPGHGYTVGTTICVPGRFSLTMSSSDSDLTWFQDWNPCPIGLYMTYSP